MHANPITQWSQRWAAGAAAVSGENDGRQQEGESERLHAKIGELTMERDFWQRAVRKLPGPTGKH